MTPIGNAKPTCERCGKTLEIGILGDVDDYTGDITKVVFRLPPRHACRVNQPDRQPEASPGSGTRR